MRSIALSAVAALLLAACGQSEPPASSAPPAPAAESASPASPASAEENDEEAAEIQAAVAALPAPYNAASYEAGQRVFAQCRSCHTIDAGGPNRVGPHLSGVMGRQAGSVEGFAYSPALQQAGFAWDVSRLDAYLADPRTALPGNRMAFAGVRNETQRRDLIAYIAVASAED